MSEEKSPMEKMLFERFKQTLEQIEQIEKKIPELNERHSMKDPRNLVLYQALTMRK